MLKMKRRITARFLLEPIYNNATHAAPNRTFALQHLRQCWQFKFVELAVKLLICQCLQQRLQFRQMSQTISVRLDDELSAWLEKTAARVGVSQSQIVRDQLAKAKTAKVEKPFMRWAGSVQGLPRDLAQRKGYSRRVEKTKAISGDRPFMRWAGVISGPKNLSSRKGFSKG